MKTVVFDTQALLVLYLGETGADTVLTYLNQVRIGKIKGHMNVINLAELYYILCRISKTTAEDKETNLRSFGIKLVFDNSELWKPAAEIKAEHAMSLADAFAAATTLHLGGTLVTGSDIEFDQVSDLSIEHV